MRDKSDQFTQTAIQHFEDLAGECNTKCNTENKKPDNNQVFYGAAHGTSLRAPSARFFCLWAALASVQVPLIIKINPMHSTGFIFMVRLMGLEPIRALLTTPSR